MLKTILIIIGVLIILIAVGAYFGWRYLNSESFFLELLSSGESRTAIYFVKNGEVMAESNPDQRMPLASTVKIIVAIEYAKQAAQRKIDPAEKIPLSDLELYYLAKSDGNAHPDWLKEINEKSRAAEGKVELRDVAKGMIKFSSNANTEYLMDKLGLANINANLKELGLDQHDQLYPIVSALLVDTEFPDLTGDALLEKMRTLPREDIIAASNKIHEKLKNDKTGTVRSSYKNRSLELQRVWSDNLPGSTVREYISIMQKLNSRTYYDQATHKHLDEVMEQAMENPKNAELFTHTGAKGGSTGFVLTRAVYATLKNGDKIEAAFFFDGLETGEVSLLTRSFGKFERALLTNPEFQSKVKQAFSK